MIKNPGCRINLCKEDRSIQFKKHFLQINCQTVVREFHLSKMLDIRFRCMSEERRLYSKNKQNLNFISFTY
jgi:hypothetical protein